MLICRHLRSISPHSICINCLSKLTCCTNSIKSFRNPFNSSFSIAPFSSYKVILYYAQKMYFYSIACFGNNCYLLFCKELCITTIFRRINVKLVMIINLFKLYSRTDVLTRSYNLKTLSMSRFVIRRPPYKNNIFK